MFIFELIIDLLSNHNRGRKRSFFPELLAIITLVVIVIAMVLVTELG